MTDRRGSSAAVLAVASVLAVPAAAGAATATVTGDSGTPIPLAGEVVIRNMSPQVELGFGSSERRYSLSIAGPSGAPAATGTDCLATTGAAAKRVDYLGNGDYTVSVRTSAAADDYSCAKLGPPQVFHFTVAASTGVVAPGRDLLTRRPGSYKTLAYAFRVDLNPGADSHEVRYDTALARGKKIHIQLAKGRKGGKFRKLKTVKIGKDGRFSARFTLRKTGHHRLRYLFKGSSTVAPGKVTQGVRVTRRVSFK